MPARGGRVLGVDVGSVRIGVALSDPGRAIASPLTTVGGGPTAIEKLASLAREHACSAIVVGLPKALSNRDTASTQAARRLAAELADRGFDVELWDERLSTVEAERILIGADRRRSQRRDERDRVAAAIILQGWLDARRTPPTDPTGGNG